MLLGAAEPLFYSFYALNTQNQQASILRCLGTSEQYEPQRTSQRCTHGQSQRRKREQIEHNSRREHNNTRAERETRKPSLNGLEYFLQTLLHQCYHL